MAHPRHLQDGRRPGHRGGRPLGPLHDVENLFIFDGSIWPTSSGMNPTATIAALALRSAEHLVETRRDLKVAR